MLPDSSIFYLRINRIFLYISEVINDITTPLTKLNGTTAYKTSVLRFVTFLFTAFPIEMICSEGNFHSLAYAGIRPYAGFTPPPPETVNVPIIIPITANFFVLLYL